MSWGSALLVLGFAVLFFAATGFFRRHGLSAKQRMVMSLVAVTLFLYSLFKQAPSWSHSGTWILSIIAIVVIWAAVKTVNRNPPGQ